MKMDKIFESRYTNPRGTRPQATIRVTEVDSHRNGVSGEGFYVILFDDLTEDEHPPAPRHFLAHVFGYWPISDRTGEEWEAYSDAEKMEYDGSYIRVALHCFDVLDSDGNQTVMFGANSWRGDNFADTLYAAIDYYADEREKEWALKYPPKEEEAGG